jgi:transposase InsO family protein
MQVVRKMIPELKNLNKFQCKSCFQGKMARVAFSTRNGKHGDLFGLIHSDVCGPFEENAIGGYRYYVTFIDDKSRYTFVYLIRTKSEVFEKFKTFEALVRNKYQKTIKILRSDNGGEYLSNDFDNFLKSKGIEKQLSVAYTPQQNGVAERMNRTLVECARTMMIHANLPKKYWGYAVTNAAYIRNRCISSVLDGKSAFEVVEGREPDLENLKVFGCVCYAHVPDEKRKKLDVKSEKCVFLGLSNVSKACIIENVSTKRIFTSRDVKFCEEIFLNQNGNGGEIEFPKEDSEKLTVQYHVTTERKLNDGITESRNLENFETRVFEQDESEYESVRDEFSAEGESETSELSEVQSLQPYGEKDYMGSKYTMVDRNLPPVKDINARPINEKRKSYYRDERVMLMDKGPRTYNEAMKTSESEKWLEAMESEMKSLAKNNVWELVLLPKGRKLVDCRWVLGRKYNSEGKPDRYKARLVAKGFTQEYGLDYEETFAPVVHFNSLRMFLTLAVYSKMDVQQMDVVTAFLYGELEEEIFMKQAPGFEDKTEDGLVCKLKKSLYGLKQSPRQWYKLLDKFLRDKGYRRSDVDPCIYVKGDDKDVIMIALYVDDLIIASNSEKLMKETKRNLFDRFEMKDLGRLHYCLGIEIVWRNNGTCMFNQSKYIGNVLERFGMNDCKPVSTPINSGTKLTKEMSPKTEEETLEMNLVPYRSAVGSLIYLVTGTRPDIAVAVGEVAKYSNNPGKQHWMAVKRILRYLKDTMNFGINCDLKSIDLVGYSDADWAGDLDTRRSTTSFLFKLGSVPICWKSKRQPTVALSTAEAEYMALSMAVQTAIWIRKLLKDFDIASEEPTVIYEDNQGCIAMAKNPVNHERTKHIDIRYNFVRERVEDKTIVVKYLETTEMLADILTKGLSRDQHRKLCEEIGIRDC